MASEEEHGQDCVAELGEPFEFVHAWLDELSKTLGTAHRFERHHDEGVEEVRERWGDRAAEAAVIHIKRDYYGEVPTRDQADLWKVLGL